MTPAELQALRDTASVIAREAGGLLAARFHEARRVEYKGGIDLVTDADKASEALILSRLKQAYPEHAVLSEEAGLSGPAGERLRWVVDPLDGTTNYAHQLPHFCVSIAVELAGVVQAGAIYDPLKDELFSAAKGQGATLGGVPIHPSAVRELHRALICTGFPYDVQQRPEGPVGLLDRIVRKAQGIRRLGSAALDLCYVACGRLDGYFEFGLKPWDLAAGVLILTEAGGRMGTLDGSPWDLLRGDIVSSAPGIWTDFEGECRAFMAEHQRGQSGA